MEYSVITDDLGQFTSLDYTIPMLKRSTQLYDVVTHLDEEVGRSIRTKLLEISRR